eukprot:GHVP01059975.1.p1 GENE.GHVP01059975.1~~GHVP01059975.1.p1  ORF type:complete len:2759 (-),score=417.37 GHVP01059975.1:66-8342(-)
MKIKKPSKRMCINIVHSKEVERLKKIPDDALIDELPLLFSQSPDFFTWVPILDRLDTLLENLTALLFARVQNQEYFVQVGLKIQRILRFTKALMEIGSSRNIYNSYDRITQLLNTSSGIVILEALLLLISPARQLFVIPKKPQTNFYYDQNMILELAGLSRVHKSDVETKRLEELRKTCSPNMILRIKFAARSLLALVDSIPFNYGTKDKLKTEIQHMMSSSDDFGEVVLLSIEAIIHRNPKLADYISDMGTPYSVLMRYYTSLTEDSPYFLQYFHLLNRIGKTTDLPTNIVESGLFGYLMEYLQDTNIYIAAKTIRYISLAVEIKNPATINEFFETRGLGITIRWMEYCIDEIFKESKDRMVLECLDSSLNLMAFLTVPSAPTNDNMNAILDLDIPVIFKRILKDHTFFSTRALGYILQAITNIVNKEPTSINHLREMGLMSELHTFLLTVTPESADLIVKVPPVIEVMCLNKIVLSSLVQNPPFKAYLKVFTSLKSTSISQFDKSAEGAGKVFGHIYKHNECLRTHITSALKETLIDIEKYIKPARHLLVITNDTGNIENRKNIEIMVEAQNLRPFKKLFSGISAFITCYRKNIGTLDPSIIGEEANILPFLMKVITNGQTWGFTPKEMLEQSAVLLYEHFLPDSDKKMKGVFKQTFDILKEVLLEFRDCRSHTFHFLKIILLSKQDSMVANNLILKLISLLSNLMLIDDIFVRSRDSKSFTPISYGFIEKNDMELFFSSLLHLQHLLLVQKTYLISDIPLDWINKEEEDFGKKTGILKDPRHNNSKVVQYLCEGLITQTNTILRLHLNDAEKDHESKFTPSITDTSIHKGSSYIKKFTEVIRRQFVLERERNLCGNTSPLYLELYLKRIDDLILNAPPVQSTSWKITFLNTLFNEDFIHELEKKVFDLIGMLERQNKDYDRNNLANTVLSSVSAFINNLSINIIRKMNVLSGWGSQTLRRLLPLVNKMFTIDPMFITEELNKSLLILGKEIFRQLASDSMKLEVSIHHIDRDECSKYARERLEYFSKYEDFPSENPPTLPRLIDRSTPTKNDESIQYYSFERFLIVPEVVLFLTRAIKVILYKTEGSEDLYSTSLHSLIFSLMCVNISNNTIGSHLVSLLSNKLLERDPVWHRIYAGLANPENQSSDFWEGFYYYPDSHIIELLDQDPLDEPILGSIYIILSNIFTVDCPTEKLNEIIILTFQKISMFKSIPLICASIRFLSFAMARTSIELEYEDIENLFNISSKCIYSRHYGSIAIPIGIFEILLTYLETPEYICSVMCTHLRKDKKDRRVSLTELFVTNTDCLFRNPTIFRESVVKCLKLVSKNYAGDIDVPVLEELPSGSKIQPRINEARARNLIDCIISFYLNKVTDDMKNCINIFNHCFLLQLFSQILIHFPNTDNIAHQNEDFPYIINKSLKVWQPDVKKSTIDMSISYWTTYFCVSAVFSKNPREITEDTISSLFILGELQRISSLLFNDPDNVKEIVVNSAGLVNVLYNVLVHGSPQQTNEEVSFMREKLKRQIKKFNLFYNLSNLYGIYILKDPSEGYRKNLYSALEAMAKLFMSPEFNDSYEISNQRYGNEHIEDDAIPPWLWDSSIEDDAQGSSGDDESSGIDDYDLMDSSSGIDMTHSDADYYSEALDTMEDSAELVPRQIGGIVNNSSDIGASDSSDDDEGVAQLGYFDDDGRTVSGRYNSSQRYSSHINRTNRLRLRMDNEIPENYGPGTNEYIRLRHNYQVHTLDTSQSNITEPSFIKMRSSIRLNNRFYLFKHPWALPDSIPALPVKEGEGVLHRHPCIEVLDRESIPNSFQRWKQYKEMFLNIEPHEFITEQVRCIEIVLLPPFNEEKEKRKLNIISQRTSPVEEEKQTDTYVDEGCNAELLNSAFVDVRRTLIWTHFNERRNFIDPETKVRISESFLASLSEEARYDYIQIHKDDIQDLRQENSDLEDEYNLIPQQVPQRKSDRNKKKSPENSSISSKRKHAENKVQLDGYHMERLTIFQTFLIANDVETFKSENLINYIFSELPKTPDGLRYFIISLLDPLALGVENSEAATYETIVRAVQSISRKRNGRRRLKIFTTGIKNNPALADRFLTKPSGSISKSLLEEFFYLFNVKSEESDQETFNLKMELLNVIVAMASPHILSDASERLNISFIKKLIFFILEKGVSNYAGAISTLSKISVSSNTRSKIVIVILEHLYDDNMEGMKNLLASLKENYDSPKSQITIAESLSQMDNIQYKIEFLMKLFNTILFKTEDDTIILMDLFETTKKNVSKCLSSQKTIGLWNDLSGLLKLYEENGYTTVSSYFKPIIEAFLCWTIIMTGLSEKCRVTAEKLFTDFGKENSWTINTIITEEPSLLSKSPFMIFLEKNEILSFLNKRIYFRDTLKRYLKKFPRERLSLKINREHLLEDSFSAIMKYDGESIRSGSISISYLNERGVDAGGLTRDWIQQLSIQMASPNFGLFIKTEGSHDKYLPNPLSSIMPEYLEYFQFIGRIMAKSLILGMPIDCHFTSSVYKHILGRKVDISDMKEADPNFYTGITWLLDNEITADLGTYFSIDLDSISSGMIEYELMPNGSSTLVTEENKKEYVQLAVEFKLYTAIKNQIDNILKGFDDVIPRDMLKIFNEKQLELLISGFSEIDVDDWRNNTEYRGYHANSPQVVWFWRAVRSFTQTERAMLLQFATGSSKVPIEGFRHLQGQNKTERFQIHKDFGDTNRLPTAQTCFNQIGIPEYLSYEIQKEKILLAIKLLKESGFGMA